MKRLELFSLTLVGFGMLATSPISAMKNNDPLRRERRRLFAEQQQQQAQIKAAQEAINAVLNNIKSWLKSFEATSTISYPNTIAALTTSLHNITTLYVNQEIIGLLENSTIRELFIKLQEEIRTFIVSINNFVIPTELKQPIADIEAKLIAMDQQINNHSLTFTFSSPQTTNNDSFSWTPSNNMPMEHVEQQNQMIKSRRPTAHTTPTTHSKTRRQKPKGQSTHQSCFDSSSCSTNSSQKPKQGLNTTELSNSIGHDSVQNLKANPSCDTDVIDQLLLERAMQELCDETHQHSFSSNSSSSSNSSTPSDQSTPKHNDTIIDQWLLDQAIAASLNDLQSHGSASSSSSYTPFHTPSYLNSAEDDAETDQDLLQAIAASLKDIQPNHSSSSSSSSAKKD